MPEDVPVVVCYECHRPFTLRGSEVNHVGCIDEHGVAREVPVCPECWVQIWRDLKPPPG